MAASPIANVQLSASGPGELHHGPSSVSAATGGGLPASLHQQQHHHYSHPSSIPSSNGPNGALIAGSIYPSPSSSSSIPATSSSSLYNHHHPSSASYSSTNGVAPSSSSAYTSTTSHTHTNTASSSTSLAPDTSSSTGTSIIPLTRTHPHLQQQYLLQQGQGQNSSPFPPSTSSSSHSHSPIPPQSSQSQSQQQQQQGRRNDTAVSSSSVSTSNNATNTSFIREGDTIYENCPPPPTLNPVIGNRSYTILKEVGDGSFGTVWLADWHSPLALPKGTGPPGPSSRPEYKGKRLVALKRMKKAFEGGWDECMKLKELKSLRSIAAHPNIIPLYDAFLLPSTKELYFVFECMEGNLYQLTKSRKGRPLAAGLVASLLKQMLAGLHHIHQSGYFHRDMKPENLLITTTGLADYPAYIPPSSSSSSIPANPSSSGASTASTNNNRPPEKDVVAIVKIADFGLARETMSKPPYTEYVSTRWYRAPEVILRSRDYSHPVDMWALGTILSEMVNLKPLFPGQSEVDQVFRICEVLGDPTTDYGKDENGRIRGGGYWDRSYKMAKSVGFSFPKIQPINFYSLYDQHLVPLQLIDMMADLMRYDPKIRLTTIQCLDHPYFRQVTPLLEPTPIPAVPNHIRQQQQQQQQQQLAQQQQQKVYSLPTPSSAHSYGLPDPNSASFPSPRNVPSSHTQASQISRAGFERRHHYPSGMPQPAPGSAASYQSSPQPHAISPEYHALQQQQAQQLPRDRQVSVPHSLMSNDSVGLGGMHVVHGGSAPSPAVGYPESVNDVSMDGADETMSPTSVAMNGGQHHQQILHQMGRASPAPSSVYSLGREGSTTLPPPHISHQQASPQLPPPHPHHYAPSYQQQLRQGINGYPGSTHSGSLYNPSVYSGISAHSGGSGGRRGSAGGASTFYDGSIFEGIAPTRAASILSLPVTYGEAPPSPNFAMPSNYPTSIHSHQQIPSNLGPGGAMARHASLRRARTDADNVSVDFEREALQRSQNNHPSSASIHAANLAAAAGVPKSDSQESLKAPNTKGKKSWMSNLLGSNNNNNNNASNSSSASTHSQPQYHPQQQPLIHPSGYAPSASSSASVSHFSIAGTSGSSLKRTPSERSMHAPEQPPTQPQPQQPIMPLDPKKAKKEAERLAKEAEKAKREAATKAARDRARAVMQKRNALAQAADPLHSYGQQSVPAPSASKTLSDKEKKALLEQRKQQAIMNGSNLPQIAEDPRMRLAVNQYSSSQQYNPDARYKARRRDVDDDVHSMSSNETRSERRFSISSQNTMSTVSTMDSDPGPPRPGRQGGFLAPLRRSPSVSSFSGQSHLSVGSTGSGHAPASGYGRRDLGTSGSGTSSLEYGLVGRFKGLSAADAASSSTSPTSASPHSHPESPLYFRPPHSPSQALSQGHPSHQQHNISLPPIQSFDRPPAKEFVFNDTTGHVGAPQTSHSNHSNNSTISANSRQYNTSSGQLPFTPEMYHHHQMQHSQQPQ